MTPPLSKTLVAGLLGALAFWVVTFLTFVLLGSGLDQASGPLVDPALQSSKLLAVWTELEPPSLRTFVSGQRPTRHRRGRLSMCRAEDN